MHDGAGMPTGITVNSFSSLSLDPPLVMFSVGKRQVSCRWFRENDHFTVNVLAADQDDIAWRFARPVDDKFEGVDWDEGENGMPRLKGAVATFECKKWNIMEGGDHLIIVGQVEAFSATDDDPLLFFRGGMRQIGE